jgi:RimJ/RimL family protein N-acetyltransferase
VAYPDDFVTARTTVERLRIEHTAAIHRMHLDEQHMAFIGGVRTEAQTADTMARSLEHWDAHGYGVWVVRDRTTGDIIGRVLLRVMPLHDVQEIELGYSYAPSHWGQGIATEVAVACLAEAVAHFQFPRFVAITDPKHERSQHVLRKLGFTDAGTIERDNRLFALFRADAVRLVLGS